jgi:hypothetical protein
MDTGRKKETLTGFQTLLGLGVGKRLENRQIKK